MNVSSLYILKEGTVLVRVQKWGNSLALRIPAPFARETGLDPGVEVDLALEEGRLVVTPRKRPAFTLEGLVSGITGENRHEEIPALGAPGAEAW